MEDWSGGRSMKKSKLFLIAIGIMFITIIVQYPFSSSYSWNSWSLPLSGKIIVIDAGHGGVDGGAVGKDGTLEKDIALNVVLYLKEYLQQQGALVTLTREDDRDLAAPETKGYSRRKAEDLKKRLDMINNTDADLFLSIHLNAIPSPKWSGAQTFYNRNSQESKALATYIQKEIKRNLENTNRGAKPINAYLLKNTDITGSLVEIGFLSNEKERQLLKTDQYQKQIAASIYQGIIKFYSEDVK